MIYFAVFWHFSIPVCLETKKIELMLTRRAKVYSSSGSRKVNIQIPNSLSGLHNDNSMAPPCE